MPLHRLTADQAGAPVHHYFSCETCGWCSPLRTTQHAAGNDGADHWRAKADAIRDERR